LLKKDQISVPTVFDEMSLLLQLVSSP